jgi:hypothetical protein
MPVSSAGVGWVRASAQLCINLKRKLGEFGPSRLGPSLDTSQDVLRFFAVILGR